MATRGEEGSDDSWVSKTHKAVKKANHSVIGYVSSVSSKTHWSLPHHGHINISLRPQHVSVEKIMSKGIDLFKHNKKHFNDEFSHELRLLHNRFNQWRFANARAHDTNHRISLFAEANLIRTLDGIAKLRYSVVLSKIEFEREKLEFKLDCLLCSQKKLLEVWESIEKRHVTAITVLKDCLYSVACRVHLLDGRMNCEIASISQRRALDLTNSMESKLSTFSPLADETAKLLSELAEVVAQERFFLEEFDDIFQTIRVLAIEEKSLRCTLMQHSIECSKGKYQKL